MAPTFCKTIRLTALLLCVILLCLATYILGLFHGYENAWPLHKLMVLKTQLKEDPIQTDTYGRLLRYPRKVEIPCPTQDTKTAVLLVFGQSNSANFQGQRHQGVDDHVVNFLLGKCYLASSPLLGADGVWGESWTLLGNKLVAAGIFNRVVLIPAGVAGTPIHRWAAGADLNRMLIDVIDDARPHYTITHVLWHQGESDFQSNTTEASYKADLSSLIGTIRSLGIAAPFYVSKASYAEQYKHWMPINPVTSAQRELVDGQTILAGVDTDSLVLASDRFDGTHFSASGQEKFADAWVALLRARN